MIIGNPLEHNRLSTTIIHRDTSAGIEQDLFYIMINPDGRIALTREQAYILTKELNHFLKETYMKGEILDETTGTKMS